MISIKDKFYKGIGEEYHNRQTESFIYQYLKREKESHIRLHLIQRYHELKEKSMSREEYTAFLIKTLQEDRQISKNRKKISLLPDFLDGMLEVMGEPKRRSYSNSEIKKVLKQGGDHLKRRKKLEIDRKLLSDITREIFECTESGKERKEWYVQLTEGFLCYDLGEISGNQYLKIIIEILLCHGKLHLSKDTRKKITEYGKRLGGTETFCGMKTEKDILKTILDLLEEKEDSSECMTHKELQSITEELQEFLIRLDVKTLLYDVGFTSNKEKNPVSRKQDRTMDMLDAYCRYDENMEIFQMTQGGRTQEEEQEYYEQCNVLRDLLNKEKRKDVFLPLKIDADTGSGVYLIGQEQYGSNVKLEQSCGFGIVRYEGVNSETGTAFELSINDIDDKDYDFPDMQSAVIWLEGMVDDTLDSYGEYNKIPPKGCPKVFQRFFEQEKTEEDMKQEAAEVAQTRQEINKEFEDEQKQKKSQGKLRQQEREKKRQSNSSGRSAHLLC